MEPILGVELVALGAAALAGYEGGRYAAGAIDFRQHSRAAVYGKTTPWAWLALHGAPPLYGLAGRLLRVGPIGAFTGSLVAAFERRDLTPSPKAALSLALAVAMAVFLLIWIGSGSVLCAIAVVAAAVALGLTLSSSARDREAANLRAEIPDALRAMAVCSQAGLSLQQTLEQTASETHGTLRRLFETAARRLATGESPDEALRCLRGGKGLSELAFVAVALDVQHQCGGSLATVLEAACDTVEGQLELERTLKVQTAQAKLSAQIVTVMPFVLIALFTVMSSDFLSTFFSSVPGMVLLGVALGMQCAGVFAVRRLLKVEVD